MNSAIIYFLIQMRKFVGQNSAGLRIRINPSLQSEQIGVIKPNGIITFVDEVTEKAIVPPVYNSQQLCQVKYKENIILRK